MDAQGRSVYFIDNRLQQQVLDARACIDAIHEAYRAWGIGDAAIHPKNELHVYNDSGYYNFGTMYGAIQPMGLAAIRIKSDYYLAKGPASYGDKHAGVEGQFCGLVLVFDSTNGLPLAILNDGHIQHVRVAAGAAVAARHLARENAAVLGILGSGGMARSHAEALCAVRPISRIKVYSPSVEHRTAFAREMQDRLEIAVEVTERPGDAVRGSAIVACCTNSIRAAVLDADWLEPGMHVTNVLGAEISGNAAARFDYAVKNQPIRPMNDAFAVAGQPPAGVTPRPQGWKPPAVTDEMPLLSDVVSGKTPGRTSPDQITYFSNNEGTGIQFAAAASVILERLAAVGFEGATKLPLSLFVQDIRD